MMFYFKIIIHRVGNFLGNKNNSHSAVIRQSTFGYVYYVCMYITDDSIPSRTIRIFRIKRAKKFTQSPSLKKKKII